MVGLEAEGAEKRGGSDGGLGWLMGEGVLVVMLGGLDGLRAERLRGPLLGQLELDL